MNPSVRQTQYGRLNYTIAETPTAADTAKKNVVLCHGFGAPGDDLVPFGPALLEADRTIAENFRFCFPQAPVDLTSAGMPGGRAWWPINMAGLMQMHAVQDFSGLTELTPDGMAEASSMLRESIRDLHDDPTCPSDGLIIGGFSQGAMVSLETVLSGPLNPELLVQFSGTLLCRSRWQSLAEEHPGCPVIQSHGTSDTVLPYTVAEELRSLLSSGGFDVSFHQFPDGHTIPMSVLQQLARELMGLAGIDGTAD